MWFENIAHKIDNALQIAYTHAQLSPAKRLQVGAVLLDSVGEVISIGYNHMPEHMGTVCEQPDGTSSPFVIHAEVDAIEKALRLGLHDKVAGSILVVTDQPCENCAHYVIRYGIKAVFYHRPYRLEAGLVALENSKTVDVIKVSDMVACKKHIVKPVSEPVEVMPRTEETVNAVWGDHIAESAYDDRDDEGRPCKHMIISVCPLGEWEYGMVKDLQQTTVTVYAPDHCGNSVNCQIDNHVASLKQSPSFGWYFQ